MTDVDGLYDRLRHFITDQTGYPYHHITLASTLQRSMGVDGDDADDFMHGFSAAFQVDLTSLEYARYFGPEISWNPISAFFLRLSRKPLQLITVAMLLKAAQAGSWGSAESTQ